MTKSVLKAPFPAFGGKSRIAATVWPRLSTAENPARNYVEPFCFSAAMLLLRPDEPQIETVNDLNAFVSNFWRAVQRDPEAVAHHADWPVNETDLHARHAWLVRSHEAAERLQRVRDDVDYFDAKIAGWWCWGACMWIGSGWCDESHRNSSSQTRPDLEGQKVTALSQQVPIPASGQGMYQMVPDKRPQLCSGNTTHGIGIHGEAQEPFHRQPALGQAGWGVNAKGDALDQKRPCFPDKSSIGRGVQGFDSNRPQLADAYSRGRGVHGNDELTDCERRHLWLVDWMVRLSDRFRPVRVCCGHWSRVCDSESTLTRLGKTAIFLDSPYRKKLADGSVNRASHIYANDKTQNVEELVDEVQAWCLKWGDNKDIRIAACGLEGEYPELDSAGWEKMPWKSQGGYGNRNKDNENAARERVWFSPHCLTVKPKPQMELFTD